MTEQAGATISFEQARRVDRVAIEQYGMSGLVLMENAGSSVARRLASLYPGKCFVVLCGKGNNGGDGYVIARHLELMGCEVRLLVVERSAKLAGDAMQNALIAQRSGISMDVFEDHDKSWMASRLEGVDVLVDCLLGTGSDGPLREPYRTLIDCANATPAVRIAVDVPSGWPGVLEHPDSTALRADRTLTFVAIKCGMEGGLQCSMAQKDEDPWIGFVEVVDIGVPRQLLNQMGITPLAYDSD